MDKLEKALQKARLQAGIGTPTTLADQTHLAASLGSTSPIKTPVPSFDAMSEADFERNRIIAHLTRSAEADAFRILRTQVLQTMGQSGFKALAITSPHYGDGKTTIAINLAISIVLDLKQTVLLVDLDLRKPNISKFLGIEPSAGLSDYLFHNTSIASCLVKLPFDRLSLLPAGNPLELSSEVLGSPKMAALARELKTRYPDRIVIYDMPPVLTQDDPIAFMPNVDAALLVVRDGQTRTDDIKRSLESLSAANVIGTVLNDGA